MLGHMTRAAYIRPKKRLKSWAEMRDEQVLDGQHWRRRLEEVILRKDSFVPRNICRDRYKWEYYNGGGLTKVERDTLFWYEPGRYSDEPEIAGIYLKHVIPPLVQERAFDALNGFEWDDHDPHRPETKTAIQRQRRKGLVRAKELHFGHTHLRQLEKSALFREQGEQLAHLEELLSTLNTIYKVVLPNQWAAQNTPKSMREKLLEKEKKDPHWGGIPWRFRILLTAFSNITLLKVLPRCGSLGE